MSGPALLAELGRCARARATGAVEWKRDKERRLFFFEDGELVLVQSNVKADSLEAVAAASPGLPPAIQRAQAVETRVRNAITEPDGDVLFHPGLAPPQRAPVDLVGLLWGLSDDLPAVPPDRYPAEESSGVRLLARMPISPTVVDYLRELDGTRSTAEVLDFGPDAPDALARALRVAAAVGAVRVGAVESEGSTIVAGGASGEATFQLGGGASGEVGPPSPRAVTAADDDIASLIDSELGRSAPPPSDPVTARFGPTAARIRAAKDHFATLGTSWEAPPDVHRRAYLKLAKELHPDGFVADAPELREVAEELFDRVRAAWEVVGDDTRRAAYIARTIHGELTEDEKAMEKVRAILDAEADFRRALTDFRAGRLAQAHEGFQRAAAAVPDELEFLGHAAYTTWRIESKRDPMAAEDALRRLASAVEQSGKLDSLYVLLGMIHRERGDINAARKAFVAALKLKPANPDAHREMKRLEREGGESAGAAEKKSTGGGFFSKLFGKK